MERITAKDIVALLGILASKIKIGKKRSFDLVIVKVDGIGDYVMWHDCISAYKKKYSGKKVLYVCNSPVRKLAEQEDFFSEIICFEEMKMKGSILYAYHFLNSLKRIKADTVITPVRERHWYADIFAMAISSKNKISILPISKQNFLTNIYNRNYTKLIDCTCCVNEIEVNIRFTKEAVWAGYEYGNYALSVNTQITPPTCKYAAISFSSSATRKNWPIERFVKIIERIPDDYKILLIGSGALDIKQAKEIEDTVHVKERILNYVGKTTVAEMVSLISKASFVIGNDSAAVHIAAAVHVPSIAIVPGPHFYRFLPYPENMNFDYAPRVVANTMGCFNCNFNCIYPDTEPLECLKRISVDMVENELLKLLNIKGDN